MSIVCCSFFTLKAIERFSTIDYIITAINYPTCEYTETVDTVSHHNEIESRKNEHRH